MRSLVMIALNLFYLGSVCLFYGFFVFIFFGHLRFIPNGLYGHDCYAS